MSWSSSNRIDGPGARVILGPTTVVSTGDWFYVDPKVDNWTIGINQAGSSVGATVTSSGVIEASFDAETAVETVLATWSLDGPTAGSPGAEAVVIPSSLAGKYPYVRARMVTINASSAGAAGTPTGVTVRFSGGQRGY